MTTTAEPTTVESPPSTCPSWCSGCTPGSDGPHMGDFRTVYLSLVEPITEKDAFTGRQTWHTRRVSVGVIANPGAQFPYVSLDLGDEVGQVVEMSYGEALDLITALTLATREVGATVRQVAAQQREVQS